MNILFTNIDFILQKGLVVQLIAACLLLMC